MKFTKELASLVIVAQNFNPSIFSRDWVVKNQILSQGPTNFIHTPVFSLNENEDVQVVLDQSRAQLIHKNPRVEGCLTVLAAIGTRIIDMLPETPYKSMGYNIRFRIEDETAKDKCWDILKGFISDKGIGISQSMGITDPTYGYSVYGEWQGFLLTSKFEPLLNKYGSCRLSFNFHRGCEGTSQEILSQLRGHLAVADDVEAHAKSIVYHCLKGEKG